MRTSPLESSCRDPYTQESIRRSPTKAVTGRRKPLQLLLLVTSYVMAGFGGTIQPAQQVAQRDIGACAEAIPVKLGMDSVTRGFERCSTSYTRDCNKTAGRCFTKAGAERCRRRTGHQRRNPHLAAAQHEPADLENFRPGPSNLVAGPAGDLDLVRRRVSLRSANNGSWADEIEEDDDWRSLSETELLFDDPELDDTYDGLTFGGARNTLYIKSAQRAMLRDRRSPEWRAKHPNYITTPPVPVQLRHKYYPDIPDPELVPHREWDEWALRAWVEKRRQKEKTDAAWKQRQDEIGRFSVLNVSEDNDSRLELGWTTTPRTWSHAEIWDLILNGGMNAHPDDVKSVKIQDPLAKADYFVEGVHLIPETEDYLASLGHWWEDEAEPDLEQEITLAAEFADMDGSNPAGDKDQDGGLGGEDDDNSPPDDEAVQLGKYFSSDL